MERETSEPTKSGVSKVSSSALTGGATFNTAEVQGPSHSLHPEIMHHTVNHNPMVRPDGLATKCTRMQ